MNFFGVLAASMPLAAIDELSDEAPPSKQKVDGPARKLATKKPASKAKETKKNGPQNGPVKKKPAAAPRSVGPPDGDGGGDGDSNGEDDGRLPKKAYKCLYRRDGAWGIKTQMKQVLIVLPSLHRVASKAFMYKDCF